MPHNPEQRYSFEITNCPTCGILLPCSLHNKLFKLAILGGEPEPKYPEFEKTQEWEYGNTIFSITPLTATTALVGGYGGKIKLLDLHDPAHPVLKEVGEYGNNIYSIIPLTATTALVGGDGGKINLLDLHDSAHPVLTEVGEYGTNIYSITPLTETMFLVGGVGGKAQLWQIPEEALRRYHEAKIKLPEIPPMPETSNV